MIPEDHICAGYYLSRYTGTIDCTGTVLRRVTMASEHSQREFFPNTWTLSWCGESRTERIERAAVFGIGENDLNAVLAWADRSFGDTWGAWSVFFDLEDARSAARSMLARADGLELWGLGLPSSVVETYRMASAPPPQQPGYAPNGASGSHLAVCEKQRALARGGAPLGYEVLLATFNPWFHSAGSLHLDESAVFAAVGVAPNDDGLLDSFEDALACCRHLDSHAGDAQGAITGWLPWSIVRYPIA